MRPIATDEVVWSVYLSVTVMSPAETNELIEMPFGRWDLVGPRNCVLDGGPDSHTRRSNFEGERGPAQDIPRHVQWLIYSD